VSCRKALGGGSRLETFFEFLLQLEVTWKLGHHVSASSVSHGSCYAKGTTVQDETNRTHLLLKTLIKDEFKEVTGETQVELYNPHRNRS
jgi:hypothetical protein